MRIRRNNNVKQRIFYRQIFAAVYLDSAKRVHLNVYNIIAVLISPGPGKLRLRNFI